MILNRTRDYDAIDWKEFFYYDETSPTFLRWKVGQRSGRGGCTVKKMVGDEAGYIDSNGYAIVGLQRMSYKIHRIVWSLFNGGVDPEMQIDHEDGNRSNNNISNLRMVSKALNLRNQTLSRSNTTGVTGVKLTHNGKSNNYYYTAHWQTLDGKRKMKHFSILKLGETEAFRLACEYRSRMIDELNANGAGYTDRHGT